MFIFNILLIFIIFTPQKPPRSPPQLHILGFILLSPDTAVHVCLYVGIRPMTLILCLIGLFQVNVSDVSRIFTVLTCVFIIILIKSFISENAFVSHPLLIAEV